MPLTPVLNSGGENQDSRKELIKDNRFFKSTKFDELFKLETFRLAFFKKDWNVVVGWDLFWICFYFYFFKFSIANSFSKHSHRTMRNEETAFTVIKFQRCLWTIQFLTRHHIFIFSADSLNPNYKHGGYIFKISDAATSQERISKKRRD